MNTTCIIGLQWGDEGKGKIVDLLAEKVDIIVRYQGGSNAGHTVVIGDQKFILHLIPTGILQKTKICVIANGVALDLDVLRSEIDTLQSQGIPVRGNLFISDRAHLVMPYHKLLDEAEEKSKGDRKIGTTGRGVGPCYTDKIRRSGIRLADIFSRQDLKEKLSTNIQWVNERLRALGSKRTVSISETLEAIEKHAEWVREFTIDSISYLNRAIDEGKKVLFEGAQGTLLNVDFGTYPYVTSSHSDVSGLCPGTGVPPQKIRNIIGVLKAYTTRVGGGPFPTELNNEIGELLRNKGAEFGATTGRPRRCGWLDTVAASYSATINGISSIALNKLDVLSGLEIIKACVSYRIAGKVVSTMPADLSSLMNAEPVYEEFAGWEMDITGLTDFSLLPANAKRYIRFIEERLSAPVTIISTGPKRNQVIFK